ncbi:MAG TPA: ABC transporter permease [Terriglobales bacterium]|nr:ABC transporter permease [Terriglobales bacterium]
MLKQLPRDLRLAARQLIKNPAFGITTIAVLALGAGAFLAILAFVDAVLVKPLPYPQPDQLMYVGERTAAQPRTNLSYQDYLDWQSQNTVFASLALYRRTRFVVGTSAGAVSAPGIRVSDNFFRTLGISPALGRDFQPGEDLPSGPRLALLSWSTWQRRYAARPGVMGQSIVLNGEPYTIVGVLPRNFSFAFANAAEYWATYHAEDGCDTHRSCHGAWGVGRLRDGVSPQAALANLQAIALRLQREYPDSNRNQGASLTPLEEAVVGELRPILVALGAGAGLLLLIAGINAAGLIVLRSDRRRREVAIRAALGASASCLFGQFAAEALLITVAGGALGLVAAYGGISLLKRLLSAALLADMPFLTGLGLDARLLAAAAAVSLGAFLTLTLVPMLQISRSATLRANQWRNRQRGMGSARGASGTHWRRLGARLVMAELATAIVLLAGAGLAGKSLYRLLHVELGITPEHLVTFNINEPGATYDTSVKQIAAAQRIVDTVRALPGVVSAGVETNGLPLDGNGNTTWFHFAGRPWHGEHSEAPFRPVGEDYFATLQARMFAGRGFARGDDKTRPNVAIVNRAFARVYFPGQDAVGKVLLTNATPPLPIQIVGVVDDIREGSLDAPIPPVMYRPFRQDPDSDIGLVVRVAGEDSGILPEIAAAVRRVDPAIVARDGQAMAARVEDSQSAYLHRTLSWLLGAFAAMALLLSVVGLYGVVAYSVSQRRREIGIRMALGASTGAIYHLVLGEAGALVAVGVTAGMLAAIAAARVSSTLWFGVQPWDWSTLSAVALILAAAALAACIRPARAATRVNPTDCVRAE